MNVPSVEVLVVDGIRSYMAGGMENRKIDKGSSEPFSGDGRIRRHGHGASSWLPGTLTSKLSRERNNAALVSGPRVRHCFADSSIALGMGGGNESFCADVSTEPLCPFTKMSHNAEVTRNDCHNDIL